MTRRLIVASIACLISACGGTSPTVPTTTSQPPVVVAPAPLAQANLVATGLSVPGCDILIQLSLGLGLQTANCRSFSGTMQNVGAGCASGVRGTTTTYLAGSSQVVGSSSWSYGFRVRPGESFGYSGGAIAVPTTGPMQYRATAAWDNVSCQ
jgi:hypothetical protein